MYINPIYLARCLYLFVRPSIHPWLSAKVLMGCPQVSCWSHNDYLWRPSPPCTQMDMFGWSFGEPPKNGSTECAGAVWQCGCGARYSLLISWPLIDYFPYIYINNIYIYNIHIYIYTHIHIYLYIIIWLYVCIDVPPKATWIFHW